MKVSKVAYPNFSEYRSTGPVYNLQRWTDALRDIYVKIRLGINREAAKQEVIKGWPEIEKFNFGNWIKYYESGEMSKYKTAQNYYVNEDINYYLPNPKQKFVPPSPIKTINEISQEADNVADGFSSGLSKEDQFRTNEMFRHKLISRLNSLEKYLGTHQGYIFAGNEYENLLHSVYELKKKIQTLNKMKLSAQTCIDLIVREAGILGRKNCKIASDVMIKIAQQLPGNNGQLAQGDLPAGGSLPQGLGNLDTPTPPLASLSLPLEEQEQKAPKSGIDGFLENLEGAGLTDTDELENNDNVIIENDVVEMQPNEEMVDLVVNAQEIPKEKIPAKNQIKIREPQEKIKDNFIEDHQGSSNFDALVNSAFDKLTVEDLLKKLQDINLIFKNKEIIKQWALVELMSNRLGIGPFLPELSEIQQKQLEANNYIVTRLDGIISTLQGSVGKSSINLSKDSDSNSPDAQLLQKHLENEERKEKERKENRRQMEEAKMNNALKSEKPEIEVELPETQAPQQPPIAEQEIARNRRV